MAWGGKLAFGSSGLLKIPASGPRSLRNAAWNCRQVTSQVWRPTMDDVERISRGLSARQRGTGSRATPHRLNAEERRAFEIARNVKHFLEVRGTGYRRERKGSPLQNTWRLWCDARSMPAIVLEKDSSGTDSVHIDLATLRGEFDLEFLFDLFKSVAEPFSTCGVPQTLQFMDRTGTESQDLWKSSATHELPPLEIEFKCTSREEAKKLARTLSLSWTEYSRRPPNTTQTHREDDGC